MERMVPLLGHARRHLLLPATLGTRQLVLKVDTGACYSVVPWETVKKGGYAHFVDEEEAKDLGGMHARGILRAPLLCHEDVALWGCIYVSEECTVPLLGLDILYNHRCSVVPSRSIPHLFVREVAGHKGSPEGSHLTGHDPWSIPNTLHRVTVNGHPTEALLDTGATHSLVPLATVRDLGLSMEQRDRPVTLNFMDGSEESTHYVPRACLGLEARGACVGAGGGGWEVRGRELDVYSRHSDLIVGMNVLRKFRMEFRGDCKMVVSPLH